MPTMLKYYYRANTSLQNYTFLDFFRPFDYEFTKVFIERYFQYYFRKI